MITKENYFEQIERIGFEKLPEPLKQSHLVIMTKTDQGRDWSIYDKDAEFKKVIDLAFEKLHELIVANERKKSLDGIPSANHLNQNETMEGLKGRIKKMEGKGKHLIELQFLWRFLQLHSKMVHRSELLLLIQALQGAIVQKKIRKTSPYASEISFIQDKLVKLFNTMKGDSILINIKDNTFKKIIKAIESIEDVNKDYVPPKPKADIIPLSGTPTNTVMPSTEFANMSFSTIGLKDKWLELIGDPCRGFTAMVYGKPKMGKSYLCVDFAGYLARHHGSVLYVAKEERLDATLQKKLKDKNVAHPRLFVSDFLPEDLSAYEFIFLDSVNKLGLSPSDLERLKTKHPGKSFIFVFQTTKLGNFKGANQFQHDVDVVIEIPEKGKAVQFGRFNQGGELEIFPETASDLASEDNVLMLAGVKRTKAMKTRYSKVYKYASENPAIIKPGTKVLDENGEERKIAEVSDKTLRLEGETDWRDIESLKFHHTKMENKDAPNHNSKTQLQRLERFVDRDDELNPLYLFNGIATQLLSEALKKEFDIFWLIRKELANRGLDEDGKWVGFDKAKKTHGMS